MIVAGLQKFSLIDYPGKICAILFTRGCNFLCPYCHNPELVIKEKYAPEIPMSKIYEFIESRRGKLDAISITGGEPTQHADLIDMLEKIKNMGFLIKLDTNGSRPEILEKIMARNLVDYFAMDIKAPLEDYPKIAGRAIAAEKIKKSIELIINHATEYEFRTTIVKSLISKDDLRKIAKEIKGAKNYFLQKFIPTKLNDPLLMKETSYTDMELNKLALELMGYVRYCAVR